MKKSLLLVFALIGISSTYSCSKEKNGPAKESPVTSNYLVGKTFVNITDIDMLDGSIRRIITELTFTNDTMVENGTSGLLNTSTNQIDNPEVANPASIKYKYEKPDIKLFGAFKQEDEDEDTLPEDILRFVVDEVKGEITIEVRERGDSEHRRTDI